MVDVEHIDQFLPGVISINMMVCAIEYKCIYVQLSLHGIDDQMGVGYMGRLYLVKRGQEPAILFGQQQYTGLCGMKMNDVVNRLPCSGCCGQLRTPFT